MIIFLNFQWLYSHFFYTTILDPELVNEITWEDTVQTYNFNYYLFIKILVIVATAGQFLGYTASAFNSGHLQQTCLIRNSSRPDKHLDKQADK